MKKLNLFLKNFVDYGLMIMLALLSIVVALQVFSRYIFSIALPWSTDVIRFFFVYIIFFGAVVGVRDNRHINIDFLFRKLPVKTKNIVSITMSLAIITFLLIFFKSGLDFVINSRTQVTPYLRVSVSFYYLIIPFSAFMMFYYSIFNFISRLKELKNSKKSILGD